MRAQLVKNHLQCKRLRFDSWVRKICWRRDMLPTSVFLGFPCGSAGKESTCNAGDLGLIPELERSPGEGKGYSLQYSALENSMDCRVLLLLSHFSRVQPCVTPKTAAHQAPLSMRIFQARILEWVAMPSSRGSFQLRDQTQVSCVAGGFFTS